MGLIHYRCPYAVRGITVMKFTVGVFPVCKITKKQRDKYWEYCTHCLAKKNMKAGIKRNKRIKKLKKAPPLAKDFIS